MPVRALRQVRSLQPFCPSEGQNPINARKGITTHVIVGSCEATVSGQNPINARKGITTEPTYGFWPELPGPPSESY